MVFAITAPQPSRNARLMTLRLVPGGPEPMTKGLGSLSPSTVVARVGMVGWDRGNLAQKTLVSKQQLSHLTRLPDDEMNAFTRSEADGRRAEGAPAPDVGRGRRPARRVHEDLALRAAWLKAKLEALPVEVHVDEAGNLWATLRGRATGRS
jgi:hypothetical protein